MIDIQYFGNFYYYKMLLHTSNVVLDIYEPNQKTSFNNRCVIAGANGPILLSVPIKNGRLQTTALKDIKICDEENWQKRHWRSILSSYNSSPWFSHYHDSMAELFLKKFTFLMDWDLVCLDWTLRHMKLSLDYKLSQERGEANVAHRPKDLTLWENSHAIRYQQVFENKNGFLPNLSILDLLFCTGPYRSVELLKAGDSGARP